MDYRIRLNGKKIFYLSSFFSLAKKFKSIQKFLFNVKFCK